MSSQFADCTLVIMAKAPKPGRVKTRLAGALPVSAVVELYRCLLADTISLAKSLSEMQVAIMSPAADVEELHGIVDSEVSVLGQSGSGLADALNSVFAHFTAAGPRRVVAFNSDSPHLPASALSSAFETLASCDLVIGPTHDGGYYLVGAKTVHPGLFFSESLGTNSALQALLERAAFQRLSVGYTEVFYDVDVKSDLHQLAEELRHSPGRAPRTALWLSGQSL